MAYQNKIIFNPKTRLQIKFLQTGKETNGQLLEMEATYQSHSREPAAHYHPNQVEEFTVLSGEMMVRLVGTLTILQPGDLIRVPKNKVHSMWNNTDQVTVVNRKVQPALHIDNFLETLTGLANAGKTNNSGMPNLFQVALSANKYTDVFRLAKPPFVV